MMCLFQSYVYIQSEIFCIFQPLKKTVKISKCRSTQPPWRTRGRIYADATQTRRRHVNYTAQEFSSIIPQFAGNQTIVSCFVLPPADASIDDDDIRLAASAGGSIGQPVHVLLKLPRWDGPRCPPVATKIQNDKVAEGRPRHRYVVVLSLRPQ